MRGVSRPNSAGLCRRSLEVVNSVKAIETHARVGFCRFQLVAKLGWIAEAVYPCFLSSQASYRSAKSCRWRKDICQPDVGHAIARQKLELGVGSPAKKRRETKCKQRSCIGVSCYDIRKRCCE